MKRYVLLIIIASLCVSARAGVPELLDRCIARYPDAYRRVWYYFDRSNRTQYYSTEFSSPRRAMRPADVVDLEKSFAAQWNATDFQQSTGAQFRGRDTVSITLKGQQFYSFDLGRASLRAAWGAERKDQRNILAPDLRPVVAAFAQIRNGHRSKTVNVSYTGFRKGIGYIFQRGQGRGLTKGTRTTLYNVSPAEFEKVRRAMLNYIGSPRPVTVFDWTRQTLIKSESTPAVYAVGYNPKTKVLNFLEAKVENEICIPLAWQEIDSLK